MSYQGWNRGDSGVVHQQPSHNKFLMVGGGLQDPQKGCKYHN